MSTNLFCSQLLVADGWRHSVRLRIEGDRIASIEEAASPAPGDEVHEIVVPTLDNLHSHAFQRGMAGLAEIRGAGEDDFWSWRDTMYRFALRMTPEQLEAVASQAYAEMLEAGFGRVGEFHYLHRDRDGRFYDDIGEMASRIVAAADRTGLRLTLLPVFYAHASFGGLAPREQQRRFVMGLDDYARLVERCRSLVGALPGGRVGVAPHSLRAVTPEELEEVLSIGAGGPVHIHVAEQTGEVRDCLAWSGARPVRWLLDHCPVDERWCLVHATHVDEGELAGMAASGAVAGLCPVTEANLGDGIFPAVEFLGAGGRMGVGSDSNVHISLPAELALLEYSQRLSRRVRNVIGLDHASTGRALFMRALAGGAQALGASASGLAPGAPADLVSLVAGDASLLHRTGDALLDSWIFASPRGVVDCVWIGGRKQVEAGRHLRREQIRQEYSKALEELCA